MIPIDQQNAMPALDKWTQWITDRRFGGNAEVREEAMRQYNEIRDTVIKGADIQAGETVVDVGCGDGMLGFKALDVVGENGKVIFDDISSDLLDLIKTFIDTAHIKGNVQLIQNSADDLHDIPSGSVDAVMTRSVLIYVHDKKKCFEEFYRVLNETGRISLWEPINIFSQRMSSGKSFMGYDVTPIIDLVKKVVGGEAPGNFEADPMMNFDERNLMSCAIDTGFKEVTLKYEAMISHQAQWHWDILYKAPPNPNAKSLEEKVNKTLSAEEKEQFLAYFKPLVETSKANRVFAFAHLIATKSAPKSVNR